MKKIKDLFAIIGILTILIAGCSDQIQIENEEQFIKVDQRIGDENKYKEYIEITNKEDIEHIRQIILNIKWKKAKVEMVHPADYRFVFQYKNPKIEAKVATYYLWISPNKDQIELQYDEDNYIKLDSIKSAELFELLTGEILSEQ